MYPKTNMAGRPTLLTEALVTKAQEYADYWFTTKDEVIPTVEGLALYIDVNKATVYKWCQETGELNTQFNDIVSKLRDTKAKVLQNKGVTGEFQQKISALLLGHEGYREKQDIDVTTQGEKLGVVILPAKEASNG